MGSDDVAIYRFSKELAKQEGYKLQSHVADLKKTLGGKGAALVQMCNMGLPVPPGFTIPTGYCNEYRKVSDKDVFLNMILEQAWEYYQWLTDVMGYAPLVSVRSGAPISMPGMMDTILNVGLTTANMQEWAQRIGDKPALDSYRRLIQMLGGTAFGIVHEKFEFQLASIKKEENVKVDAELSKKALKKLIVRYAEVFQQNAKIEFPDDAKQQLGFAIKAVFDSWMNPRAIEYRKINNIPDDMGTAVTVQCMVFGNMGEDSGSGVLFTRDPSTGEKSIMAEYLTNAQGEDVVAGIRTPLKLTFEKGSQFDLPWATQLSEVCVKLEDEYRDMVDIEFTVQQGELFILQSRAGKRSARAAFQIAHDLVEEGVIDRATALSRLTREQFKIVRRPSIDPKFKEKPSLTGLPACPGVVSGKPVFSSQDAINCTEPCILVTHETTPEDIAGMAKAVGILTQTGGATSHAAVVARAMDKPCIVGATNLDIATMQKIGDHKITIDGSTGWAWFNIDVPVIDASDNASVKAVMQWCCESVGAALPAVLPRGDQLPHVIQASQWWGDNDVLDVVLADLIELPSRDHVVLDLAGPHKLRPAGDELLEHAFGGSVASANSEFSSLVNSALYANRAALAGLTVVNIEITDTATLEQMRKAGLNIPTQPKTLADVLAGANAPDEAFIKNIVGGPEAWAQLQKMLQTAGVKAVPVPKALPAEYCTFTMLQ
jgi:pyruvate,orthophosphate dikinase